MRKESVSVTLLFDLMGIAAQKQVQLSTMVRMYQLNSFEEGQMGSIRSRCSSLKGLEADACVDLKEAFVILATAQDSQL